MSQESNRFDDTEFKKNLLTLIPFLRAFSRSLCGHRQRAEDVAQDALVKAWAARHSFEQGTNLKAWLFTILRNEFMSQARRSWRQMPWNEAAGELIPAADGQQKWSSELSDVARALHTLPVQQREALILVGVAGFSYEETAKIANTTVGTVKSRVSRARRALTAMMDGDEAIPESDFVLQGSGFDDILAQIAHLVPQHDFRIAM